MIMVPSRKFRRAAPNGRQSETELQATLNIIPAYTWYAAPSGALTFVNERCADYLGLPADHPLRVGIIPSDAAWDSHILLLHPDDHERTRTVWSTCLSNGYAGEVSFRVRGAEGAYRWFLSRVEPLRAIDGTLRYWIGINLDIEELKETEFYLAEGQRLAHTGSWAFITAGFDCWSPGLFQSYGLDASGKAPTVEKYLALFHPEDRESVVQEIENMWATVCGYGFTKRIVRPDGKVRRVRYVGTPASQIGALRGFIGTGIDVTQQKQPTEEPYAPDPASETVRLEEYLARVHPQGRIVRPDGKVRHVHWVGAPVIENGKLLQIVGTAMDVTEHERLTQELQRREVYLAEAQRLSQTGSFGWRTDNGEMVWSAETYRIFEYDCAKKPTLDMVIQRIDPEYRLFAQQSAERAYETGQDFEHECRLRMPGGVTKHIHVRSHALHHSSGGTEFVGAVIDVTKHKEAEQMLQQREMEVRQMLDFMPHLIVVFGPNHERLYANRAALDYRGIRLDEWREAITVHPDDKERVREYADRASLTRGPYDLEVRLRNAEGHYRWFLARYSPMLDDNGQIKYWYVALTDIEDRKRTEERLQGENATLREEIDQTSMFEEIVGTSPALQTVLSRVSRVAPSDATVLITGETGTGKELIARGLHRRSSRGSRPFISVNCAAIPRELIPSELFGHERGAFTGATQRRLGRFELADGGTIFLDEIGELAPDTQIALLRVLQEREFERIGGSQSIRVNVRVIAATNRDLKTAVANGTFRQELFYRLNVFPIAVPPLRERKEDILMLVEYFIQRYANKAGKTIRSIDKKTLEILQSYDWPGNIRELQNVIERSVILTFGDVLSIDQLWLSNETSRPNAVVQPSRAFAAVPEPRTEREIIERVLAETRGRVSGPSGAAAKLRVPASTLASRIKVLKINRSQFKFLS
jgi:PAS domain S-box-containing protein